MQIPSSSRSVVWPPGKQAPTSRFLSVVMLSNRPPPPPHPRSSLQPRRVRFAPRYLQSAVIFSHRASCLHDTRINRGLSPPWESHRLACDAARRPCTVSPCLLPPQSPVPWPLDWTAEINTPSKTSSLGIKMLSHCIWAFVWEFLFLFSSSYPLPVKE